MSTSPKAPAPKANIGRIRMILELDITPVTEAQADRLYGEIKRVVQDAIQAHGAFTDQAEILDVQVDADDPFLLPVNADE